MAITHIAKDFDSEKTLCGSSIEPPKRRNKGPRTIEGERVLYWQDWMIDDNETCVQCEANLQENGLERRG